MAHWPFFDLRVVTPRLELRYPDDALVGEIATLAAKGIHDPATMPFSVAWTDVPTGGEQERNTLQFFWRTRAEMSPEKWVVSMAVLVDGDVAGVQSIHTENFHITLEDNHASLGVTRKVGYEPNGETVQVRRGQPGRLLAFRMPRSLWEQGRRDDITVEGLEPCLEVLGLVDTDL